ncbi:MAG: di-trans,poly-cis-decaprenylcistransferase [Sinobacteraceae bacterium]|nr:di-trans,poly-cis-decaprenylcistransferase [Nevskiaceae bacterium]
MALPRHIAITMDGNGRWAATRGVPRAAGHRAGLTPTRMVIQECSRRSITALTLFAFSSENWKRPAEEVSSLMALFVDSLDREIDELHANQVRVRFIGDRAPLAMRLQTRIVAAEQRTAANGGLQLQIAMSYGGRWDIVQASQELARQCSSGALQPRDIDEDRFAAALQLAGVPDADLLIRTGGEQRISNFLLWNAAYAELYFTDVLWPDFGVAQFEAALAFFASRERRFGLTHEQLPPGNGLRPAQRS